MKTRHIIVNWLLTVICLTPSIGVLQPTEPAAATQNTKRIHIIYFGGNDCPPCLAFRGTEFPKFEKSQEYSQVQWSFVTKSVRSQIPSGFFLPAHVKPLRDTLLQATGSNGGSAQVVILVDGKVHDVFFGSRDADFYQKMVRSVSDSKLPYPGERCLERSTGWSCKVKS